MVRHKGGIKDVQEAFASRASIFSIQEVSLTDSSHLIWIIRNLQLDEHWKVLEVASASGHMTRAIAPHVHTITALDATPAMLKEAQKVSKMMGIPNIQYCQGLAQHLPFEDNSFDFVTSRFFMHHIPDNEIVLKEMFRVCKPGGKIAIIDWVVPEDDSLAKSYNNIEKLRDPTHLRSFKKSEFKKLIDLFLLENRESMSRDVEIHMDEWLLLAKTPKQQSSFIQEEFARELQGFHTTGMRPFKKDGFFYFYQTWSIESGTKPIK